MLVNHSLDSFKKKRRRRIKTRQVTVPHVDAELNRTHTLLVRQYWIRLMQMRNLTRIRFRWRRNSSARNWVKKLFQRPVRSRVTSSLSSVHGDEQIFVIFYAE